MSKRTQTFYATIISLGLLLLTNVIQASNNPTTIISIYRYLAENYPQYEGKTFAKPSINQLRENWIIQTPNIWGKSVSIYNKSFIPTRPNKLDSEFRLPTCKTNSDCQGYASCQQPNYTLGAAGTAKSLCVTKADQLLQAIYSAISSANHSVDIVMMRHPIIGGAFATKAFTPTIKNALLALGKKTVQTGQPIQIRLLEGQFVQPLKDGSLQIPKHLLVSQRQYLEYLTKQLPVGNKLEVSVGNIRSCLLNKECGNNDQQHDAYLNFAWNHGKIINVDNHTLITGGHNLYGAAYLQKNPVNDLSIEISGPIADGATIYTNKLWDYVTTHKTTLANFCQTYKNGKIADTCPIDIDPTNHTSSASAQITDQLTVRAMYTSKLNNGVLGNDADQSELARVFAFTHAQHSIKISQQALFIKGFNHLLKRPILHPLHTIAGTVMQALAKAIYYRQVNVYIITSSLNLSYSSYVKPEYVYQYLENSLMSQFGLSIHQAATLLGKYLHMSYIAYNYGDTKDMSHNKLWIVDDKLFYVGSHNIYPSSLQQFGIIVSSTKATKLLEEQLWDPIWKYSVKYLPPTN